MAKLPKTKKTLVVLSMGTMLIFGISIAPAALGRGGDDATHANSSTADEAVSHNETQQTDRSSQESELTREENQRVADSHSVDAKKLTAGKLQACKRREAAINNIMSRIADRGERQLDVFNKIAERTEAFYIEKGNVLSNYDALVANVNAKKSAAEAVVATIKSTSVSFKCDGSDPKGAAGSFKASLKNEISALKEYRTAVRKLIVGVKSVNGGTGATKESSSD